MHQQPQGPPPHGQQPPHPRIPLPAGQLPMRPEIKLAQAQQQHNQQRQQQQQQFHQQQYNQYHHGYPPHPNAQLSHPQLQHSMQSPHPMYMSSPFGTNPSEAALRQAHMQSLKQQQIMQQQQAAAASVPLRHPTPHLPPHLADVAKFPASFPGPGPGPDAESTMKSEWNQKVMRLNPRPLFHPTILDGLSNKSVGYLCSLAKDVIQELVIRLVSVTSLFKGTAWKGNAHAELEMILSYCNFLLSKIREIQGLIDKKTINNQKISANDFIELMALPLPPKAPPVIEELRAQYHGNECHLQKLSNAFKKVEWLGENSDPRNASLSLKKEVQRIMADNAPDDPRRAALGLGMMGTAKKG